MSQLSPKPVISRVHRTWRVPPGLKFALVEDMEQRIWVVESCPVGTHVWTVAQAAQLPKGARTRRVLEEIVHLGRKLEPARKRRERLALPRSVSRETAIAPSMERDCRPVRSGQKLQPARRAEKTLAGV